jgi:benzoylformate decarboxylase
MFDVSERVSAKWYTRRVAVQTVRERVYDLFRRRGLTTLFANPGSTEIPFLVGMPDDLEFVLGLHEGSVVGMASGYAIGRGAPALVLLHTTAGLGNAVGALATARVNRAPLVVLVGQQDRRHLSHEPFLAGQLTGLAGVYPVRFEEPASAQDVPAAIERAYHAAAVERGPALVIVPMDDWAAPANDDKEPASAVGPVLRAAAVDSDAVDTLAGFLTDATSPAIVVGAGADDPATWAALVELAERLVAPVFQEAFGGRAGFPQDHPLFAGVLSSHRPDLRERLAPFDTVLVVGAPAFRQAAFAPGPFLEPGTQLALVSDDAEEIYRSPAHVAVLAPPAAVCRELAGRLPRREADPPPPYVRPAAPAPPAPGEPLTTSHVLSALAERLPRETILLEEAPVDRPDIHARLPAREPMGYVSAAQGGLGFAVPAAAGLRLAVPGRPVCAVIGDGAAIYQIQGLWSAARYGAGPLYVVLANGGYAIMDRLAERAGGTGPWPGFEDLELATIARSFGCEARRIVSHDELIAALDEIVPTLNGRTTPFLLDVAVTKSATFGA